MKVNLDKYIRELLLQHDCVILPGLGGFVANYRPATFDAFQKTAIPPSREILFNANLVHNDGLLYAHISRETEYGYKEVQAMTEVYFKTIRYEIGKGLKFSIDELGYFFMNKARKIEFTYESTDNLLLDSYGLSYLNYEEIGRTAARPLLDTYRTLDDTHPVLRQNRVRKWAYTGAAACLVAAMILIPVKMGNLNFSSFDLGRVDSFKKEEPVKEFEAPSNAPATIHFSSSPVTAAPPALSYHIIVGSFKDIANARQLKGAMTEDGYEAEILTGENDFYRVSVKQYPEKETAVSALASIRDEQAFKSAWILTF